MGASHGYQRGHQWQAWNTKSATAATKKPVCKHRSLSTPPQEPVQPATARVRWSRDNFPRRTHSMPQAIATSCQSLPPQARPAFRTPPSPPAWVSQSPVISCYFNPILTGQRTDDLRWPTCRGGAKSTAEPQELCEQRREREISPSSLRSSGLNLHNQLDVPCICGIPE